MTKYLFFVLLFVIFILLIIILFPLIANFGKTKPAPIPPPILTAPSISPTSFPTSIPTVLPSEIPLSDQIKIQSDADRDFAEKAKQIKILYPWLDKLPIQAPNYIVDFDVHQKQFIAKLYPSSTSNIPIDQQVNSFKSEITTKLQSLIPDYTKYNIKWDIIPE